DYTAVVGVGLNRLKGHIYVRDVVMDRLEPEQMYEHVLAMALRLRARVIGLEVTSLNEFILQPFKNYMLKHGHVFELVELKARDKKTRRISMLAPYYRQGNVYHNSSGVCRQLEAQLLSFPHSQYDDVMDALAYIIELMEIGGRYFSSAEAPDKNERAAYERLRLEDVSAGPINGWQFV
ncbi:phage terminase large subunit, partial [Patescibacteria group bacterium]|nr:phage terminase large subunit [Patescibacteria group bacterium]